MNKASTTWFAATAFAGLTFSLINVGAVVAQPPGRGPGGLDGPGRGGPPNVDEMFSRMDENKDGKLSKDEVPGPLWERLAHIDADGNGSVTKEEATKAFAGGRPDARRPEGARPDGPRPDASPSDRPQGDAARGRGPRPPMEQPRGDAPRREEPRDDAPRGEGRSPRDAHPEHGRPAPQQGPHQPVGERGDRPDSAHRGPAPFAPEAFFDRLDKNHDGSLSRDEFQAVAEFHRGQHPSPGSQGMSGHRGPGGRPMAHRGPGMPGGGPPWAHGDRNDFHGPQGFHGGPPWARPGHGPQMHGKFAGPPWAQHAAHDRNAGHGKKYAGHDKKKPGHGKKKGHDHGKKKHHDDRTESRDRDHHRHSDTKSPHAGADLVTVGTTQLTSLPL